MSYNSIDKILKKCEKQGISFADAIINDDMYERKVSREDTINKMQVMWEAMLSANSSYDRELFSKSGLVGSCGGIMEDYSHNEDTFCGSFVNDVMARALKMGESNACMKRIVAAPTAGACGVLPAVLTACYEKRNFTNDQIIEALFVAGGIGQVIASRAFIAGALGGCQAEIGSASAMAAGALVALKGGSPTQIANAAAIALKNLLGLVCDPVAGLVEVPCVKRNVIGAINALSAADMSLAGVISIIPFDQVVDAMREVGENMDEKFRETGLGGLAATNVASEIYKNLKN